MQKIKNGLCLILCFVLSLSVVVGLTFLNLDKTVHADTETQKALSFCDDFTTTKLSSTKQFSYNNLVNDAQVDGLLTGASWGAGVTAGDGEIIYKIETGLMDSYLFNLKLNMSFRFSHQSITNYIGENKLNILVYVSNDNVTYEKVYDAYNDTDKGYPSNVPIKGPADEGFIATFNKDIDLSTKTNELSQVFVKIEVLHPTYDELLPKYQEAGHIGNNSGSTILLNSIGAKIYKVGFEADFKTREEILESLPKSTEDFEIDFDDAPHASTEWKADFFEVDGLKVENSPKYNKNNKLLGNGVQYKDGYHGVLTSYANSQGYFILRYYSPNKTFKQAFVETYARLFNYHGDYETPKLDYYVSLNGRDYEMVFSSKLLINMSGSNCVEKTVDYSPYVSGKHEFFVKIVLEATTDVSWININRFAVDVEYETVDLTIDYGNGQSFTVKQDKGGLIDQSNFEFPVQYNRLNQKLFLDEKLEQEFTADTPITQNMTLYTQGSWGEYTINYVLDGGINSADNPSTYKKDSIINLKKPTKEGYVFAGWYRDEALSDAVFSISKGQEGNVTLYAKWIEDKALDIDIQKDSNTNNTGCGGNMAGCLPSVTLVLLASAIVIFKSLKNRG
ncbi:MAG: hypothetical protein E7369_06295 [Clostridiales bacterium]|nr:hypothetical protein [Clostridiales bacterium]